MLAARRRLGAMCVSLISLGANPSLRNRVGKNACFLAKEAGWKEISDWLEKKVGAGVANMATYSDVQYDRKLRFGLIKMRELLESFMKAYLQIVMGSLGLTLIPIGPLSTSTTTDIHPMIHYQHTLTFSINTPFDTFCQNISTHPLSILQLSPTL